MNGKTKYAIPLLALAFLLPIGLAEAQNAPGGEEPEPTGPAATVNEDNKGQEIDTIEKLTEPQEFVGRHTTDARQIGDYLYVRHTYTSDELGHLGIDRVFREEVHPIPAAASGEEISQFVNTSTTSENYTMSLVHGDDVSTFDKMRINGTEISAQSFQQWNIVKAEKTVSTQINNVDYWPVSHEDWASKKSGHAYQSYDPINLIWSDTVSGSETLMSKVSSKMQRAGWDDICLSTDLYVNIGGTWTKQDKHYIDQFGPLPCFQYHIRAWEIDGNSMIGSAHKEDAGIKLPFERIDLRHTYRSGPSHTERDISTMLGGYHSLTGFDVAEDEAAGEFAGGCWSVAKDSHYLGNQYTRETIRNGGVENTASNNGYATVIRCS